jgi:plasmid stability protein
MSVQITIRNVPDNVRNELAARAAAQGRSMQEFLRAELEHLASRPSMETLLAQIRERVKTAGTTISAEEILGHLDADRR